MSFPAGISLATITVGSVIDFFGESADITVTVAPVLGGDGKAKHIVHAETGHVMLLRRMTFSGSPSGPVSFDVPHTDQPGFVTSAGETIQDWAYSATVVYGKGKDENWTKVFQPKVGQNLLDLDLIPDGNITAPVTAPMASVTSVNGDTGAVTLLEASPENIEAGLPLRLSEGEISATIAGETSPLARQVAPGLSVVNPQGLRRWSAKLADAQFSLANILCMGDSITQGVGSDGLPSSSDLVTFRTNAYAPQLRKLFAARFGDAGEGAVTNFDGAMVPGGGATSHPSSGPMEVGMRANAPGQFITLTVTRATAIDFWTWNGSEGVNASTYTVDGGAAVQFSAGTGDLNSLTWKKTTISGLADGPHTVVFNAPSSGALYLSYASARVASSGVLVHRLGKAGNTTANVLGLDASNNASTAGKARLLAALGSVPETDLAVIPLGTNDYGKQNDTAVTGSQPGATPAQYEANLRAITAEFINRGACVLLLGEPYSPNLASPETYTQDQYFSAARAVAASTDHVAFAHVPDVWGTAAQGLAAGYYPASGTVHPSRRGHGSIAQILLNVLSAPYGYGAPQGN